MYGDIHYIANSFCRNVLKIANLSLGSELHFLQIVLITVIIF
jgi:hypothetical protein